MAGGSTTQTHKPTNNKKRPSQEIIACVMGFASHIRFCGINSVSFTAYRPSNPSGPSILTFSYRYLVNTFLMGTSGVYPVLLKSRVARRVHCSFYLIDGGELAELLVKRCMHLTHIPCLPLLPPLPRPRCKKVKDPTTTTAVNRIPPPKKTTLLAWDFVRATWEGGSSLVGV